MSVFVLAAEFEIHFWRSGAFKFDKSLSLGILDKMGLLSKLGQKSKEMYDLLQ